MSLYMDEIPPDEIAPHEGITQKDYNQPLKPLDTVIALYDFPGTQPSHLPLSLGDTVHVLAKSGTGWWDGVILSHDGELFRGWFPNNYVRSVNYVQPVLNKLKSNKEIDSITAANTAANVLIPQITNLLQRSLADASENSPANSSRKNSVVSFASSETSVPSDSKQSSSIPTNPNSTPIPANVPTAGTQSQQPSISHTLTPSDLREDDLPYLLVEEAEEKSEAYKAEHKRNLTWLPRITNGDNMVFYNEKFGYSESIPLVPLMPNIDITSGSIELPSREAITDNSVIAHNKSGFGSDKNDGAASNSSTGLSDPPGTRNNSSAKGFDPLKRDSNASSVNSQSTGASSYHNFNQPFFALDDLFYKHIDDVTYWTELMTTFNYLLDLSCKALKDHNKQLFSTHFNTLTKVISILANAARLVQDDFVDTKYEKSMRRKLKRTAASFAQVYINGLLHLSVMHASPASVDGELFTFDISKLNKSTSIPGSAMESPSSSVSTVRHNSTDSNALNSLSNNLNQLTLNRDEEFVTYMQQIDHELEILRTNFNALVKVFLKLTKDKKIRKSDYDGSDTSEDEGEDRYNILPQIYPRFLANEFNGGNWCNPFFVSNNLVLNASGDDLKNRYHLKVIIDKEAYDSIKKFTDEIHKLANETLEYLDPAVQHKYYNEILKSERNTHILRLIYKLLYYASSMIDMIESFDFTVFCLIKRFSSSDDPDHVMHELNDSRTTETTSNLTFDYPVVLEFFQFKQQFHDLISNVVMATQSLTLDDPDTFKAMKEDDPLLYNRDVLKVPTEKAAMFLTNILTEQQKNNQGDSISLNPDTLLANYLSNALTFQASLLTIIQQLIDERETTLNYATRVMHDDFNVQLLVIERNNTILSEKSEEGHSYFSGKKQGNDIPWYLEGDEEYDLLLDVKGSIKGGTKAALIAHLTHHDLFDSSFNTAFMLTFATMMSVGEFINLLINRFQIDAPEGLSYEEYNIWISKKQDPIRLRVMNVMKLLVEKHWSESYRKETVLKSWLSFVQTPTVQSYSIGKILLNELTRLLKGEVIFREREPSIPNAKAPAPLTKGSIMKKLKLLDIDYIELARQLTLREFKLYSRITKLACLCKVWGKKSGLNESIESITAFIRASNQLTNYVAYMILRKQEIKKRVQIIRYFVQVAEKCRQYNNFSSMTAIISALYSSPIHRLKKTWKYVSLDTMSHLQNMNKLMNSSRNFNEYRDVLKFVGSEPCVPFFGVYLSDLTFVLHGNPDTLMNRTKMINFGKRAKTSEIVMGIDRFKSTGYNLQEVPEVQIYLDLWFDKCPTIDEQYQLSLNLEPRESVLGELGGSGHGHNHGSTSSSKHSKTSLGSFAFRA